ncbi:MAG: alanine--tRNA ligase, partial [Rhodocyclaceae bacterium]|nr:alanine--tRNA ligase [Rhodocyclaceae bacterium]
TAAAAALHTTPAELPARVQQALDHTRTLERQIAQLKGQLASAQGGGLAEKAVNVDGLNVLAARVDAPDTAALRQMLDDLRSRLPAAAVLLAAVQADGKVQLAAGCAKDAATRIKAGDLMRFAATQMGGKGGGKPDMAMGGAPSADKLDTTLAAVPAWVKEQLG